MPGRSLHPLKLVFMGNLFHRGEFSRDFLDTAFDTVEVIVLVGESQSLIEIVDTSGENEFLHTGIPNDPETDLFLICVSVTEVSTFDSTSKYVIELEQHCKSQKYVFIGLKIDLSSDDSGFLSITQQNQSPHSQKKGIEPAQKSKLWSIWNVHHF
jgi:GTPase SAR1 family protein